MNARSLTAATLGGSGSASISIDGAGSKLTISGPTGLTLGAASGLPSALTVQNGGTLVVPAGEMRVRATGTLAVPSGTLQVARLVIDGGTTSAGEIEPIVSPSEVSVVSGGKFDFAAGFFSLHPVSFRVSGTASSITSPGKIHLISGSFLTLENGGELTAGILDLGSVFGAGGFSADGAGTTVTATVGPTQWGTATGNASASFSNSAAGYFGAVSMPSSPSAATSTVDIVTGADVTMTSLFLGTGSTPGATGLVTVSGPGSTLTLTNEVNGLALGGTSGTVARLTVADSALFVAKSGAIHPTGVLLIEGGVASLNAVATNAGTIDHRGGALSFFGPFSLTNSPTGKILIGDATTFGVALVNQAGGRVTLTDGNAIIAGGGSIQNSGLINGTGSIEVAMQNFAPGEIRVENGKSLRIKTLNGANAGKIQLLGGSLEFVAPVTNGATGQISGRGAIDFGGGLINQGSIQLSGGFSDISGSVTQSGAASVIVSGGATGTFYDNVTHNGAEFRTSAGARSVFFGAVNGAGPFTGTGEVFFEGGYLPGNSPSVVTLSTSVTFTVSNTLKMEIGGLTPGPGTPIDNGYDKLIFTNAGTPMVTWGGTLSIDLINGFTPQVGQVFDLFDFDPSRDAGAFASIQLADALPAGTALDFSQLYTTGEVAVVPEPSAAGLILLAGMGATLRRRRDEPRLI